MTTQPTRLTARTPEDLLAMVPVVLGFAPEDSVVMLTFGADHTFHARVDLPGSREDVPEVVSALLDPVRAHRVRRVVFVIYAGDHAFAKRVSRSLVRAFAGAGVEVIDVLRADGRRWFPVLRSRPGVPAWGVPYDLSAHAFTAQSVLEGRVTHASRDELRATLACVPDRVAPLVAAVDLEQDTIRQPAGEAAWARRLVRRHLEEGSVPSDRDAARLLVGMSDLRVRDAVWTLISRDNAAGHVDLWADLVRRSPETLVAPPAALLAFAAWLTGHGALAWCAVDRCLEADPGYRLAGYVADALAHAVPPGVWEADRAWPAVDDPA